VKTQVSPGRGRRSDQFDLRLVEAMAQEPGDLAALDSIYPSQKEQTARDGSDERNRNDSAIPKTNRTPPRRRFDQRVMVNGSDRVFFEKDGFLQRAQGISMDDGALMVGVKNIARRLGNDISEANPSVIPVCPMAVALFVLLKAAPDPYR